MIISNASIHCRLLLGHKKEFNHFCNKMNTTWNNYSLFNYYCFMLQFNRHWGYPSPSQVLPSSLTMVPFTNFHKYFFSLWWSVLKGMHYGKVAFLLKSFRCKSTLVGHAWGLTSLLPPMNREGLMDALQGWTCNEMTGNSLHCREKPQWQHGKLRETTMLLKYSSFKSTNVMISFLLKLIHRIQKKNSIWAKLTL